MDPKIGRFSMDIFSLEGKTAIVTGANQGLGMGYAYAFAKAGADLFIPHFSEATDELRGMVEALGRKIVFLRGDLTDDAYRAKVVDRCMAEYGKIDILVNNAGMSYFQPFLEYPDSAWGNVMELNINTMYYLSHRIAKIMVEQGSGKIINIGSALSFTADHKCPPYAVSKHGVLGLTKVFANELGQCNIQTNAICPGFFVTEVNKAISSDQTFFDKINARIPAGRWGSPADLMGTAVFLASAASDYINGTYVNVDGGFRTTL